MDFCREKCVHITSKEYLRNIRENWYMRCRNEKIENCSPRYRADLVLTAIRQSEFESYVKRLTQSQQSTRKEKCCFTRGKPHTTKPFYYGDLLDLFNP